MALTIQAATPDDAPVLAELVGALLQEIMDAVGSAEFHFNPQQAEAQAEDLLRRGVYFAFIAKENGQAVGVVCLYEGHAIYTEGAFGTIAELYVCPAQRSQGIGRLLLDEVRKFAVAKGWKRLEVTTPPLPMFQRTLAFYENHGFAVAGGRKLKSLL